MDEDDNEFEIEVTDLRTGAPVRSPHLPAPAPFSTPTEASTPADRAIAPAGEHTLDTANPENSQSRRPSRRHLLGAAFATGLVLLALILLLPGVSSLSGATGDIGSALFPPTPTLGADTDIVTFAHIVPWGQLSIDGQPRFNPLVATNDYSLPRGRHTLQYRAQPFATLRCVISVPAAASDTCPLYTPTNGDLRSVPPPGRFLDLRATPDRLSLPQRQQLQSAVVAMLKSTTTTTTIQPGDHYATPDGRVLVASQPLPVIYTYTLVVSAGITMNNEQCNPFCVLSASQPAYDGPGWQLATFITPQWSYVQPDGQTATVPIQAIADNGASEMNLYVSWNGSWQLDEPLSINTMLGCSNVFSVMSPLQSSNTNGYSYGSSGSGVAPNPADGCLIEISPPDSHDGSSATPAPAPPAPIGYLLYHFGALVAGTAKVQKLFPTLPTASTHEAAIIRQIVANMPPSPN